MITRVLPALLAAMLCVLAADAQDLTRDQLGRDVKLTILVDKVMQPVAGWTTEEWMIKETADAGFNVYSPRLGFDKLDAVEQITQWCEEQGIYHQVWIRGTLGVTDPEAAKGRMVVWRTGGEQPLWSPNADELWDWLTHYCVEYARISAQNPHLMGIFLDYENYAAGPRVSGMLYDLSYDQMTMDMFAEAEGAEIPELAPEERYQWLVDNNLHDAFDAWQVQNWRTRCRELREAVDEIDPNFQFCMYPAPGSRFMLEAAFPEWTNERAPLIFADAVTYGRPTSFLPQSTALEHGRQALTERMASVAAMNLPFIYTGGIDPAVAGADPEYSGKNAVMISDVTDGYWIFYEGPTYDTTHPDYFKWFAWANSAIAAGEFAKADEPRETPDPWAFAALGSDEELGFAPDEATIGQTVDLPEVKLRGRNMLMLRANGGEPVEIGATIYAIGPAQADLEWELRDLSWEVVESGVAPFGEPATISFTPEEDGIYALLMYAGSSAWAVTRTNAPIGIYAGKITHFIGGPATLYFSVPEGAESFSFDARGMGAETVRLNAVPPSGEVVATGQTSETESRMTLEANAGEFAGQTWVLEITRADKGVLEDWWLAMSDDLPPVLSFIPEHVFMKP